MARVNSSFSALEDYAKRLVRMATLLVDMHMDIAIQEANYEKRRLLGGLVMMSIGIGLFAMGMTLLQVLSVLILHVLGLSWIWATVWVAIVDFAIGGIFAAAARARLRGPLMSQTKSRLARSTAVLRNRAPSSEDRLPKTN